MAATKEERLQIRVDPARKRMLQGAPDAADQSLSAFILAAASRRAEAVLADSRVVELSPDAARAFSEALDSPARVNEPLAEALDRPRHFRWAD